MDQVKIKSLNKHSLQSSFFFFHMIVTYIHTQVEWMHQVKRKIEEKYTTEQWGFLRYIADHSTPKAWIFPPDFK